MASQSAGSVTGPSFTGFPPPCPMGQRWKSLAQQAPTLSSTAYSTSLMGHTNIVDMVCWRAYSLYDCTAEFRFFWVNSKLTETSAGDPPSTYHRYGFSAVPMYESTLDGLQAAYSGSTPYLKDGLLFYNKFSTSKWTHTPYTGMERCGLQPVCS